MLLRPKSTHNLRSQYKRYFNKLVDLNPYFSFD